MAQAKEEKAYTGNSKWADIEPIAQDDGPNPPVPISYSKEFTEVMGFFRAILRKDERSQRALDLTTDVIRLNPANYTAWSFRRLCLYALKEDLRNELVYASFVAAASPKNYQLWHHRRVIVDKLGEICDELRQTESALRDDSKNYHVWAYRQWLLRRFKCIDEKELAFTHKLILEDIRNNSAWNQRFFVVENSTGFTKEVLLRELKYAQDIIETAPNNESPWNYLRGVTKRPECEAAILTSVMEFCKSLLPASPALATGDRRHALAFMVELYEQMGGAERLATAVQLCDVLEKRADPVRKKYWAFEAARLQQVIDPKKKEEEKE